MKKLLSPLVPTLVFCCLALPVAAAAPDIDKLLSQVAAYRVGGTREALRACEQLVGQASADDALQKQLEAGLAKLLTGAAPFEVKRFAGKQLAVIGTDASLPALASLLSGEQTAGIACLALSTLSSEKAGDVLRAALATAPGLAKVQVINTLANRQDAQARSAFSQLATHANPAIADAAIAGLGRIASRESYQELSNLRRDLGAGKTETVLEAMLQCAGGLLQADEAKMGGFIYRQLMERDLPKTIRRAALAGLLRTDRDGGEQRIFVVLRTPDPDLKPVAIAAIPALKSAKASAKFAGEMDRLEPAEQALLVQALGARDDDTARDAVVKSLNSGEAMVRRAALAALAGRNDLTTVPVLARLLVSTPHPEEKQMAEQILIGFGHGLETDIVVLSELSSAPEDSWARLINVVGRRGDPRHVPTFLALTTKPAAASAAFQALARTASHADLAAVLDALVHLKVPDARSAAENAAAQTLSKVADPARRSAALRTAFDAAPNAEARMSVLRLLPLAGDDAAFALLQAALQNPDTSIRETAIRALADWPNPLAWGTLSGFYAESASEARRVVALRALVRLAGEQNAKPDATLIERYRQLLDGAKNDNDRKLILGALAGAAHPDALPLALPLLANPAVRAEAHLAIRKIAGAIQGAHPQAAENALQQLK